MICNSVFYASRLISDVFINSLSWKNDTFEIIALGWTLFSLLGCVGIPWTLSMWISSTSSLFFGINANTLSSFSWILSNLLLHILQPLCGCYLHPSSSSVWELLWLVCFLHWLPWTFTTSSIGHCSACTIFLLLLHICGLKIYLILLKVQWLHVGRWSIPKGTCHLFLTTVILLSTPFMHFETSAYIEFVEWILWCLVLECLHF